MKLSGVKRGLRRRLPAPVFNGIQRIRKLFYRPPAIVHILRCRHEELNREISTVGAIAVRPGINLQIVEDSRNPFEWFCWRSPEMVQELDTFIQRVRGCASLADVGANHGIFSLVFLSINGSGLVVSVDPSPIATEILCQNRKLNHFESSIRHQQVACGSSPGTLHMHYNWHHLEASSHACQSNNDVVVCVETLDDICAREGVAPEVIKIDVEGFELDVLKGAEQALCQCRTLFLEVHPLLLDELGIAQRDIFDWLTERDWMIKSLRGEGITAAEFNDQINTFWTVCERRTNA
jgi:FkbM family methyltransferase